MARRLKEYHLETLDGSEFTVNAYDMHFDRQNNLIADCGLDFPTIFNDIKGYRVHVDGERGATFDAEQSRRDE